MCAHRRIRRTDNSRRNDGFASNNFNLGNLLGLLNNIDLGQMASLLGSINTSQAPVLSQQQQNNTAQRQQGTEESKAELIRALQTILDSDKAELIQVMLQLFSSYKAAQNQK